MENITERQWNSRTLFNFKSLAYEEGFCTKCHKPLNEWNGAYYGVINDFATLYDFEYSYESGYCEECAKSEAIRTRNLKHTTCPSIVSHIENIYDNGYLCERTVYEDGMIIESDAKSIEYANSCNY